MNKRRVALVSTGGTVEKTYDELAGVLENRVSVLDVMLATLNLQGVEISRVPLLNMDSLEMSAVEHDLIARTCNTLSEAYDGLVVTHGTDRLAATGDRLVEVIGAPRVPIVLTGAMRPYVMRNSDALQNLTEALLAVQILDPGVFAVLHNKVLRFPGVAKDRKRGVFIQVDED